MLYTDDGEEGDERKRLGEKTASFGCNVSSCVVCLMLSRDKIFVRLSSPNFVCTNAGEYML